MTEAIDNLVTEFSGQTFSDNKQATVWLRERMGVLVEGIYKEELAIADARWKKCEEIRKGKSKN